MKIWTRAYNPFTMGGTVNKNIATEVEVNDSDWFELANGFYGAKLGNGFYVDKVSGGLLGKDLDLIKEDIKSSTKEVINAQLQEMKLECDRAILVSNEDFFRKLK